MTQHNMKTNNAHTSEVSRHELEPGDLKLAAQRELAAGVFKQAAQDLRRFHGATSKIERELYIDAYRWLTVDDCSSPFSFLNVCQLLNLAPENVRQDLIDELSLGALGYWTQRCKRAASRFRISCSQFFMSEHKPSTSITLDAAEAETW